MPIRTVPFANRKAPCGRVADGKRLRHRDEDDCLLSDELFYECGCQTVRHEYHDGSFSQKVVRHDGTVVVDELFSER